MPSVPLDVALDGGGGGDELAEATVGVVQRQSNLMFVPGRREDRCKMEVVTGR